MINVVDRVSTYPGRVKLTKANGTTEYVTWERADEPTVEGTPINKALFDSIAADIGLAAEVTLYVSGAGSDTLGTGSSSNPYKTINKALSTLPKNLNGKRTFISIAGGTYNEIVNVDSFSCGRIIFGGSASAGVTISGLVVNGCKVLVDSISLTVGNNGVFVESLGMLYSTNNALITVNGAADGVTLRYGSVIDLNRLTINNATNRALQVQYGSTASVGTLAGSGNNIGVYLYNSTAYVVAPSISATVPFTNDNGAYYKR